MNKTYHFQLSEKDSQLVVRALRFCAQRKFTAQGELKHPPAELQVSHEHLEELAHRFENPPLITAERAPARGKTCQSCHWWVPDGDEYVCNNRNTNDGGRLVTKPEDTCDGWRQDLRPPRYCGTCQHWWENMKAHICMCSESPFEGRASGAKEGCIAWVRNEGGAR